MLLSDDTFPVDAPIATRTPHKIPQEIWPDIVELSKTNSYCQIAEEYGVSREAIRRTIQHYNGLSKVENL